MLLDVLQSAPGYQKMLPWGPEKHNFEVPERPGEVKIGPRRRLGPILEPLQLLERSWSPLGALLDGSGSGKKSSCSALGRSKMIAKGGFAHLESQKAPKTEPGRAPNRAPEATPAEKGKSTKLGGRLTKIFDFFMAPGPPFGSKKNWTKTGSQSLHGR